MDKVESGSKAEDAGIKRGDQVDPHFSVEFALEFALFPLLLDFRGEQAELRAHDDSAESHNLPEGQHLDGDDSQVKLVG